MGTIFQKLNYLDGTKGLIRQAINDKGGTLTENNTFRSYADAIADLPSGGNLTYSDLTKDSKPFTGFTGVSSDVYNNYTPNADGLKFINYTGIDATFSMPGVPINKVSFRLKLKIDKFTPNATSNSDIIKFMYNATTICTLTTPTGSPYLQLFDDSSHYSDIIDTKVSDLNNKKLNFTIEWNQADMNPSNTTPTIPANNATFNIYIDDVKKLSCTNSRSISFNFLENIPKNIRICNIYENLPDNTSGLQCSMLECGLEAMQ